ncbi:hypothetical protein BGW42_002291 [Actinomortierella wolfii]|nr:hypothetical protein BGW42_002291 [Actinomortierella wolfii]
MDYESVLFSATPVATEPPGPTNQPTATVPTTGVATGTAPATPLPTNGGNQTVVPTPTRPRPTRKPTDPLATLTVIKPPNRKDNPELYPIGSNIEFAWTIDTKNLLLPPDNITLDATPRSNPKEVYTIAVLPAGTTNFTWTAELQRNDSRPLIQDLYTLRIYDGQVGPYGFLTDGGGYLQSYVGLVFGLYFPRGYNNPSKLNIST